MSLLTKIFGDPNEKILKKLQPIIERINTLEKDFEKFSDEQLKQKTIEFRQSLKDGASLNFFLPEAFGVVREAAKRTLGQRHFDVQLLGGIVLHQGKIAEMKTGEGKTLAATLAVYLNALAGQGVHVVTVNDYLARRDTNWMGPIYDFLGLSVGCIQHEKSYLYQSQKIDKDEVTVEYENLKEVTRQEAYLADITYGTNNEFGFDYLRDNMALDRVQMVQRGHYFAIVDEVDSILIDEARTPLIISAPDADSTKLYETFARIVPRLKENEDYNVDEKMRAATLTEQGILKVEKILGFDIYTEGGVRYAHHLEEALRAQVLFQKDKNYVVKDDQVIIVDDFTGRLMFGRRYSGGLHQAIEAKEGVRVQQESRTLATITFQNYFRMYKKLAGMTGTAVTSAEEFEKVYHLDVVAVPTNEPMIREDLPDRIYRIEPGKFKAVVQEIKKRHQAGQPVLCGTVSIEKNEMLSALLKREGIVHEILNAKNHESEAQIIAKAGQNGAVTIATNMAGRGVDIKLGQGVVGLGGLFVLGTERHEARRIDNQLRGRSGRQGDPGESQFFVSLEDDLMRIFGPERIKKMLEFLKLPEDMPIENKMISHALERAQARIEGFNFDARQHVLEYDDVMNRQREKIYTWRKEVLDEQKSLRDELFEMVEDEISKIVDFHTREGLNIEEISENIAAIWPVSKDLHQELLAVKEPEAIKNFLNDLAKRALEAKEKEIGFEEMPKVAKFLLLRTIDAFWMEHLDNMDHLRDSVRLRAYGQQDPLVEFKSEGHRMFRQMLDIIQSNVVRAICRVGVAPGGQSATAKAQKVTAETQRFGVSATVKKKIGRNDPCPCGKIDPRTGKVVKYKKCCYPKYG